MKNKGNTGSENAKKRENSGEKELLMKRAGVSATRDGRAFGANGDELSVNCVHDTYLTLPQIGQLYLHRFVWVYFNGLIPPGHIISPADGDYRNCALKNLRCILKSDHFKRWRNSNAVKHIARIRSKIARLEALIGTIQKNHAHEWESNSEGQFECGCGASRRSRNGKETP